MTTQKTRTVVVGAGNAALCAALSARQGGADVEVLEWAPVDQRGGNSAYTGGLMRVAYDSVQDLLELMPDLSSGELSRASFGEYPVAELYDDIARLGEYQGDPDLIDLVATKSRETLRWMRSLGVRFVPAYGGQSFELNGQHIFWGGLSVEVSGGGRGLVDSLVHAAEHSGVTIHYSTRALSLLQDGDRIVGVRALRGGHQIDFGADSVILASGGFEANPQWRAKYLGPGWDLAKVRGTKFNFGDGIRMALEVGAQPFGHWSGCHAVGWDRNAPATGNLSVGDGYQKHSYPFGIMVNARGERFVDEGADFRNFTYAEYGRRILMQPGRFAWQVFDNRVTPLLRDEYRIRQATKVSAQSLEELAKKLDGVDAVGFLRTVHEFNEAVVDVPFNPAILDGRSTSGIWPPKSNWANRISEPPFEAYAVTCGITFTFGGLRVNTSAQVLDCSEQPISGLFACGELVGGIFYMNYPGGSGLTAGAVLGRVAGAAASSAPDVPTSAAWSFGTVRNQSTALDKSSC